MILNMSSSRRAFTLLELLAAVLVMSVISAVLLPVISSASESYTTTRDVRTRTERVALALDRISRLIREAPVGDGDSGIGVSQATSSSLEFIDGNGFQLESGSLMLLVPDRYPVVLCDDVDDVVVQYLGDDGVVNTIATPGSTHRFVVTVTSDQLEMSVIVHPRVWIGQEEE